MKSVSIHFCCKHFPLCSCCLELSRGDQTAKYFVHVDEVVPCTRPSRLLRHIGAACYPTQNDMPRRKSTSIWTRRGDCNGMASAGPLAIVRDVAGLGAKS